MHSNASSILLILSLFSFNLYAAPCESNFTSSGNFITGTSYKTFADSPITSVANAFDGALADIAKEPSWKILTQDKSTGFIHAAQAEAYNKGNVIPLDVQIEVAGSGSKISISYATPTGSLSPVGAIKSQFCKTINAALSAKDQSLNAVVTNQTDPVKTEQISKASVTNTGSVGANSKYEKNGMPCVAEICLGEEIAALQKIKWDKVKKEAVNKNLLEYVNKNFRGNLKSSTPYLRKGFMGNTGVFDNQALTNLKDVVADCVTQSYTLLSGSFTSIAGNPTEVIIRLVPSVDNQTQKWTVVDIRRTFKTQSETQINEVIAQLKDRYSNFPTILNLVKEGEGQVFIDSSNPALTLTTNLQTAAERARLHPACGGAAKVNID